MDTAEAPTPSRRLLLVVGQGRSGTSLLTGLVQRLGMHVPQPEVRADATNPVGFGEPQWVVELHTRLLKRAAVHPSDARPTAWAATGPVGSRSAVRAEVREWLEQQHAEHPAVVIKDPRSIWFLSLWREAARDLELPVCVATMLRPPAEVVSSKINAYGKANAAGRMAGWLNGMLATERATRDMDRSFVRYDELLSDWTRELSRVDAELGTGLVDASRAGDIRAAAQLVDPTLRRSQTQLDELSLPAPLRDLTERTWSLLSAIPDAGAQDAREREAAFDALRQEYRDYYAQCESVVESSIQARTTSPRKLPAEGRGKGRGPGPKQAADANSEPPPQPDQPGPDEASKRSGGGMRRRLGRR